MSAQQDNTSRDLVLHQLSSGLVSQRKSDGYINATLACQATGKLFADYRRLKTTQEFLDELSSVMGIPITELIQTLQGGDPSLQGTWIHPRIAIHLAQWCSPEFAVRVTEWVKTWMETGKNPLQKPLTIAQLHLEEARVALEEAKLSARRLLDQARENIQAVKVAIAQEKLEKRKAIKAPIVAPPVFVQLPSPPHN